MVTSQVLDRSVLGSLFLSGLGCRGFLLFCLLFLLLLLFLLSSAPSRLLLRGGVVLFIDFFNCRLGLRSCLSNSKSFLPCSLFLLFSSACFSGELLLALSFGADHLLFRLHFHIFVLRRHRLVGGLFRPAGCRPFLLGRIDPGLLFLRLLVSLVECHHAQTVES